MSGSRVIHADDLPWETGGHGDLFGHRRRRLARAAGGRDLGCSMMELDPGKTAWPFHYHQANEEALYVLHGEATLRLGAERLRVRAGDFVALPTGPEHAHQLTNTGTEVVRYLVLSTMVTPDVCVYPDARKVGVVGALAAAEGAAANDEDGRVVTFPLDAEVGYWEGETTSPGRATEQATEAKEADVPHKGPPGAAGRKAKLEDMIESELDALKRKLALETMTEDDLDALRRKLDGDG